MNKIDHLPRQLEVLRQLPHPLHVKGMQFKNINEAKLIIREMNEVESRIVTPRGTSTPSYVTYRCTSHSCDYKARLSIKKSVIILKDVVGHTCHLGDSLTSKFTNYTVKEMAKVSEQMILNNLKVSKKDISFLVSQYTMKKTK